MSEPRLPSAPSAEKPIDGPLHEATLRLESALARLETVMERSAGPGGAGAVTSVDDGTAALKAELETLRARNAALEGAATRASRALGGAASKVRRTLGLDDLSPIAAAGGGIEPDLDPPPAKDSAR